MLKSFIRFIKSLFNKDTEARSDKPSSKVKALYVGDKNLKRFAIIVGHTTKSQGAVAYTGESEWSWNNRVAKKVKNHLHNTHIKIFYRNPNLKYKSAMKELAKEVSEWGADFSIELHFNSFHKTAYGCEILVANDAPNRDFLIKLSDMMTNTLAKDFDLRERGTVTYGDNEYGDGVKVLQYGERGYHNLAYLGDKGVDAILIEPMFANKATKESKAFFEGQGTEKYATFIASCIHKICRDN